MKRVIRILLALMLLLTTMSAAAQPAALIEQNILWQEGKGNLPEKSLRKMTDGDYSSYFTLKSKKKLTISTGETVGALYLKLFDRIPELTLEACQGEEWVPVEKPITHLTDWYPLPEGSTGVRITSKAAKNAKIAELSLYTPGEKPEDLQEWQDLKKADLMLLVAHPDDEILWFGGLLPTYAGEKKLAVQVVHLVPTGGVRRLELLDALWICGVHNYPAFLNFLDKNGKNVKGQYERWGGKDLVLGRVIRAFRQYRPEVVITHGEKGEYGHGAHKTACEACKIAFKNAADKRKSVPSFELYGTWQVKKLYLHEYEENPILMDWHVPLEAFGGRDAFSVAQEAMNCHASQIARGWALEDHGKHDNAKFGLYASTVGPDTGNNDLMEHITDLVGGEEQNN